MEGQKPVILRPHWWRWELSKGEGPFACYKMYQIVNSGPDSTLDTAMYLPTRGFSLASSLNQSRLSNKVKQDTTKKLLLNSIF